MSRTRKDRPYRVKASDKKGTVLHHDHSRGECDGELASKRALAHRSARNDRKQDILPNSYRDHRCEQYVDWRLSNERCSCCDQRETLTRSFGKRIAQREISMVDY